MPRQKVSSREIEQKYEAGTLRLSQERNDYVLPQVLDFVKNNKWINLHPEYQRRQVWDKHKRSLFIESLLMNLPIPPVFLFENDYSRYEVMDGQQRLSTIVDYYENRFKLSGLEEWSELNGMSYSDCPPIIQRGLDRRRISAVVVLAENLLKAEERFDIRRTVFQRLNTGGVNLNPQEIRNCLYSGKFNDLLLELAGNSTFDDLCGIPRYDDHRRGSHISAELAANPLFRRMRDCELVLRFFAFRETKHIKGSVVSMLDGCMKRNEDMPDTEITTLRERFIRSVELCRDIFQDKAFKIPEKDGTSKLSFPLYDAEMVAADRLADKGDALVKRRAAVQKAIESAIKVKKTYEIIVGKPNTAAAIRDRLATIEAILARAAT